MAGSSAPVMYWAVLNTLCCALQSRDGAFSIPSSDAASQDALDGAAVKPFEDLWAHVNHWLKFLFSFGIFSLFFLIKVLNYGTVIMEHFDEFACES